MLSMNLSKKKMKNAKRICRVRKQNQMMLTIQIQMVVSNDIFKAQ
ncbi:unnamed protein product [Trichobilharzia regenti]|nr:unnamed protein product [Trichobilharzia regenti]